MSDRRLKKLCMKDIHEVSPYLHHSQTYFSALTATLIIKGASSRWLLILHKQESVGSKDTYRTSLSIQADQ